MSKAAAALDEWLKDVAPTADLRQWYGHAPARFEEFADRYRAELAVPPAGEAVAHLLELAATRPVVLLTATRNRDLSGGQVLFEYLAPGM